jgi:hypothetical protein
MTFKEAFADARSKKQATFDWNGKSYSTQLKGEEAGKTQRPKARPKAPEADRPKVAGAQRPKARPANKGPSVMADAPAQGKAPKPDAQVVAGKAGNEAKAAAFLASAKKENAARTAAAAPKVIPLGKSNGIGGRAAEAVKSFMGALRGKPAAKPKAAFKTPNRADVAPKGKKK